MPWRDEFTDDDIESALARLGLGSWTADWDLTGDIELQSPVNEPCTYAQLQSIAAEFKPASIEIQPMNVDLPPDGRVQLRVMLIWDKS